jgi:phosphopantetheinyl transferase
VPLQTPRLIVGRNNNPSIDPGNTHSDRVAHIRNRRKRQQSEAAWARALTLLPNGDWTKETGIDGRPRVIDSLGRPGPDVSISHSQEWYAAAMVAEGRVGIDVEAGGRARDWLAMARDCLSPEELRAVARDGEAAFLAFWTLREAVAKLGGDGLAAALALDGATIVAGRNGSCGAHGWLAAHRRLDGADLAIAWTPTRFHQDAEKLLNEIIEGIAIDCHHSHSSI